MHKKQSNGKNTQSSSQSSNLDALSLPGYPHRELNELLASLPQPRQVSVAHEETMRTIPRGKTLHYTEGDHRECIQDLTQDTRAAISLLDKLKAALAGIMMEGVYAAHEDEYGYPVGEQNAGWNRCEDLSRACCELQLAEKIPTDLQHSIRTHYNELVPRELQLSQLTAITPRLVQIISASSFQMTKGQVNEASYRECQNTLETVQKLQHSLVQNLNAPLLPFLCDAHEFTQETLETFRAEYRELVRETALLLERGNWCSPGYGESKTPQRGRFQQSQPFRTDYQRWHFEELRELERSSQAMVFRTRKLQEEMQSALFPSAMTAYQAVFQLIQQQMNAAPELGSDVSRAATPAIVVPETTYIEVHNAITDYAHSHGLTEIVYNSSNLGALRETILSTRPIAVFIEPVSNTFEMQVNSVLGMLNTILSAKNELLAGAHSEMDPYHLIVVVDSTLLGRLAHWKRIDFSKLPKSVSIINVESLIKFGELGQDLVPAALVTTIGPTVRFSLDKIRHRAGFIPSETAVRRLGLLTDDVEIDRRLERHSRNCEVLLQALTAHRSREKCLLYPVHPLMDGKERACAYRREASKAGARFSLAVNMNRVEELLGEGLLDSERDEVLTTLLTSTKNLIIKLAAEAKLNVVEGTSFGFDYTRLAVYSEPSSLYRPNLSQGYSQREYLRVAPGQESMKDIKLLGAIFQRTEEILTHVLRRRWNRGEISLA